jgi:hypothetical protein
MKDEFFEERIMLREASLISQRASEMILDKIDAKTEKFEAEGKDLELTKLVERLPECHARNIVRIRILRMKGLLH